MQKKITKDSISKLMMEFEDKWNDITRMIIDIIKIKKNEENKKEV